MLPPQPASAWPAPFSELPRPAPRRRFTGDPLTVEPDVAAVQLGPEDEFLVVATDGLWDVMPPQVRVRALCMLPAVGLGLGSGPASRAPRRPRSNGGKPCVSVCVCVLCA